MTTPLRVDIEVTDEVIDQITKLIEPYKATLLPQQAEQLEKFVIDQIINRTVNNRLSGAAIKRGSVVFEARSPQAFLAPRMRIKSLSARLSKSLMRSFWRLLRSSSRPRLTS